VATTYGLTAQGFVIKTLTVVRADLDAAMRSAFGLSLVLGDKTLFGQINAILAERYAELWALAQAVYSSQDPNAATDLPLDNICALTGTTRPPATFSTVLETLIGTPTSVVPINTILATASTSLQFKTTATATIASVSAWVPTTAYLAGNRVTNGGSVFQCTIAGTSAGSGGPSGPPTPSWGPVVDGGVTWLWLGAGTGAVDILCTATTTGAVAAGAYDLNVIVTPASGLTSCTNILDATLGRDLASNQELRLLRESELSGDGVSTADAIRASLLKVSGVTSVTVFHNDTDTTDANGVPPHAVECLVLGGADQDIADVIFAEVAAGIATYSSTSTSATVVDSQGISHTVYFTRPTQIQIYVDITVKYDATLYPSDG
jgi:uncharacterized phage protein gp47/JayE